MKHIKIFEDFVVDVNIDDDQSEEIKSEEDVLKRMIKTYTSNNKQLDGEEESALIAICDKIGIPSKKVYTDILSKKFKPDFKIKEHISISHRSEYFLRDLICSFDSNSPKDIEVIKNILGKLQLDYDELKKSCAIKHEN